LNCLLLLMITIFVSCKNEKNDTSTKKSPDPKIRKLKIPEGFKAERLYSPGENEQGSWVSMTFDDKGRMIASDQFGALYRLQLPSIGDSSKPVVEKLNITTDTSIGYAQGLLWAFNSLYVSVNNMTDSSFRKSGLYRLQDTDGDDQLDKLTLLKSFTGEGEHGPHSIKLSPDKKSLYLIAGNHTDVPEMNAYLLPSNWQEDNLYPLIKDPSGHANKRYAPGGWIARLDSAGKNWELVSAGYRNAFDIAFNDVGDMFAYDSDMEYDIGLPWYRPTRIVHATSGSEFGWRTGDSKWSPSYPDNLPAVLNIGQGSPTNLVYGGDSKFPAKYRRSLFAFDWSFGIIYAVQLKPEGSTYTAQAEEFISGAPLPLTDGIVGPDGALYFLTGGRKLDSDLYRISYDGEKDKEQEQPVVINEQNKLRRQLEEYHREKAGALDIAWPQLKNNDRFIRYAARIAVEHQPVNEWQDLVLKENDPITLIQSAVALARQGDSSVKDALLQKLNTINYAQLTPSQQLDLLRAYELIFSRMGLPAGERRTQTIAFINPQYPTKNNYLNRQLSKLLITLQAPDAVSKTMAMLYTAKDDTTDQKTIMASSDLIFRNLQYGMDIASMLSKVPPAQQTYYAIMLSAAKEGWTTALQEEYFKWFNNAFTNYKGGQSYVGFLDRGRKLALQNVSKNRTDYFDKLSGGTLLEKSGRYLANTVKQPVGPGRKWLLDSAIKVIDSGLIKRDFENGKNMFAAVMCQSCHKMRGEGAEVGPDLTQIGTRFSTSDILEAIIYPDKTISDQYASTVLVLKNGQTVAGRLINQDESKYYIVQNPFTPQSVREVPKAEVLENKLSQASIMPPGMINRLNAEELKDLIAFLMAGGNKEHPIYSK
ncbi:MAG: c-type cytochrome, partial [Chitinophagaceae bacterium]|nr:c-type cytochrome [Chitinophagaceae bacterium]